MADERYTFEQARLRLEEIAVQARKKDTTLEKSLDLLEEGARLALMCTELVDHTDFADTVPAPADVVPGDATDPDEREVGSEYDEQADEAGALTADDERAPEQSGDVPTPGV